MRAESGGMEDESATRAAVTVLLAVPTPKVANRGDLDAEQRKQLRDAFGACWTDVLRGAMDEKTLRRVLRVLPDVVLPCVAKPLTLVDMLDAAYTRGGVVSVLALGGVFHLMSRQNLDVPDFYTKLYALIDSQLLASKHRDEFFTVAERFLSSGFLPAQLVAAFVKRTARLSLSAPAAALLVTMPFASNLLVNHDRVRATLVANTLRQKKKASEQQQQEDEAAAKDPFDETATDPTKAHALRSTLWEFSAFRDHYCPAVAKLAGIFRIHAETQSVAGKDKPVDTAALHSAGEFAGLSYRALFDMEALQADSAHHQPQQKQRTRDAKDVALEFRPWASLFEGASSSDSAWQLPAAQASDSSSDRLSF